MLRKKETSSWVVEGWVASESSLESHLMPKRLQHKYGDCSRLNCAQLIVSLQEGLDSFSKSENDHSGLLALITIEVTMKGDH